MGRGFSEEGCNRVKVGICLIIGFEFIEVQIEFNGAII